MAEERKLWDPESETMPLDKLKKLQEERLREMVSHAYEKTIFYRRKYDQSGIKPSDINTLDDLRKLPIIKDSEMRQTPLEEKLSVPWEEIKNFCSSSGTTGFPELHPFTRDDFQTGCVDNLCRAKWAMGLRPSDVVQNLTPFTCMSRIDATMGASIVGEQVGRGNFDHQVMLAKMAHVTVLEQLPSFVLHYFERAKELGINIRETKLRLIIGLGEGWAASYRKKVESQYGVTFRSLWGLSEAGELTYECEYGGGMHINADRCILEVIDPETEQVLGPGEEGELVVTNFSRRAVPRIRFRTSDIAKILPYKPCPCGRTFPKISMIRGRMSQVINVRGKKFFPVDVEEVLGAIPDLAYEYQIVLDKPREQETLKVKVEHVPEVKNLAALQKETEEALSQALGIDSEVNLVPIGSIGRALFKAQRIVTA